MPVYLPHRGRLIEFRRAVPRDGLPPLPESAVTLTDWATPARVVPLDFDTTAFKEHPGVEAIHEVWYLGPKDDLGPAFKGESELGGAGAQTRDGLVLLFFSEEEVLESLAPAYGRCLIW